MVTIRDTILSEEESEHAHRASGAIYYIYAGGGGNANAITS